MKVTEVTLYWKGKEETAALVIDFDKRAFKQFIAKSDSSVLVSNFYKSEKNFGGHTFEVTRKKDIVDYIKKLKQDSFLEIPSDNWNGII